MDEKYIGKRCRACGLDLADCERCSPAEVKAATRGNSGGWAPGVQALATLQDQLTDARAEVEFLRSQRPCAGSGAELRDLLDRRGPESIAVVRVDAVRELLAEEVDPLRQALRQVLGLSDMAEARIILRAALPSGEKE